MGGKRKSTKGQKPKPKPQKEGKHKAKNNYPVIRYKRRFMEIAYQASAALAVLSGIIIGILLFYNLQTPAIWVTFTTAVLVALAFCCFWQDKVWKSEEAKQQAQKVNMPAPQPVSEPFSIDIKVAFPCMRDKGIGFWLAYKSKYGDTLSIIPLMLYVQLANLQSIPSTINTLSLEIKTGNNDWQKLYAIHRPGSKVLFPIEGLRKVGRVIFDSGELLDLLNNRAILPHETVKGWIFYYAPKDIIFPVQFRFRLIDTAKIEYTQTITMPNYDPDVLNNASINIAKEKDEDVSDYRIIEYNESF
jgi:hypothetical protein